VIRSNVVIVLVVTGTSNRNVLAILSAGGNIIGIPVFPRVRWNYYIVLERRLKNMHDCPVYKLLPLSVEPESFLTTWLKLREDHRCNKVYVTTSY
jgi:hypothetical protein